MTILEKIVLVDNKIKEIKHLLTSPNDKAFLLHFCEYIEDLRMQLETNGSLNMSDEEIESITFQLDNVYTGLLETEYNSSNKDK